MGQKCAFETYFRLFMQVKNLLWRSAQQSAIPMAKLVRLCTKVTIPEEDKDHFYKDFADVVKKLLSLREPHTFFTCLAAFMDWADQTDLPDLNFMVPDDSAVQNLLQMYMEKGRIDISGTGQAPDLDERMTRLSEDLMVSGLQDVDIMEKFCSPIAPIPLRKTPRPETGVQNQYEVQNANQKSEEKAKSDAEEAQNDEFLTDASNKMKEVPQQKAVPLVAIKLVEV